MKLGFWNFYPYYNRNRMFTDSSSPIGDDLAYPMVHLGKRLRARGHEASTLDMEPLSHYSAAVFLDHPTFLNSKFRELRRLGTKLYLVLCENPAMRPDNYWRCNHGPFEKVFTWDPSWIDNKKYFKFHLPIKTPDPVQFRIDRAEKQKFCLTIASQKYSSHSRQIYTERVKAIRWFEQSHPEEFDLFGTDWDRRYFTRRLARFNLVLQRLYKQFPNSFRTRNFTSWRGLVPSKNATMRKYKFSICYENAVFPGYVTEKMLDALFAGCVPIDLGAPDVTDYIPPETFIDKRKFSSYEELYRYLKGMSESEYAGYLSAIENFIRGEKIKAFGADAFADLIIQQVARA